MRILGKVYCTYFAHNAVTKTSVPYIVCDLFVFRLAKRTYKKRETVQKSKNWSTINVSDRLSFLTETEWMNEKCVACIVMIEGNLTYSIPFQDLKVKDRVPWVPGPNKNDLFIQGIDRGTYVCLQRERKETLPMFLS